MNVRQAIVRYFYTEIVLYRVDGPKKRDESQGGDKKKNANKYKETCN